MTTANLQISANYTNSTFSHRSKEDCRNDLNLSDGGSN